jgi:hypothetical protein
MRHMLIAVVAGMMLMSFGCKDGMHMGKHKDNDMNSDMKMSAAKDDCPHCPGVQKADASGKCPACGMKVKG